MAPKFEFDTFFARARQALNIDSQNELAALLKVHRSAVTQAKRKGSVPESWITRLTRSHGVNPVWLETGQGRPQLAAAHAGNLPDGITEVPKYRARISAGGGSFEMDQRIENFYFFYSGASFKLSVKINHRMRRQWARTGLTNGLSHE